MKSNVQKILLLGIILSCMLTTISFCEAEEYNLKIYAASGWSSSRIIDDYRLLLCDENRHKCSYIFVNNLNFIVSLDSILQKTMKREIFIEESYLSKNYKLLAIINNKNKSDTVVVPYSCQYIMINSKLYFFDKSLFEKLISKLPYYLYYDIKNDTIWEQK